MYHTSPTANLVPEISEVKSLCLADDLAVCQMYLRGDGEHHTYEASWDEANLASEAELCEIVTSLGWDMDDKFESQPYVAMKNSKVRAAVLAAGFDGARYEDTHEGCNYETVELLRKPAGFRFVAHSVVDRD